MTLRSARTMEMGYTAGLQWGGYTVQDNVRVPPPESALGRCRSTRRCACSVLHGRNMRGVAAIEQRGPCGREASRGREERWREGAVNLCYGLKCRCAAIISCRIAAIKFPNRDLDLRRNLHSGL